MDVGAHLPLMSFPGFPVDPTSLGGYTRRARELGFGAIAANDHLVFATPWFDGPTALASVAHEAAELDLMTTVLLPVVRGPIAAAKFLSSLALLTPGRVIAGIGPGSSSHDYDAAGRDFEQRWQSFELATRELRAALDGTGAVQLAPRPTTPVDIWLGSWGSPAGLRRVARLADGWLASAYNTDPARFREARRRLDHELQEVGRDPRAVPDALSTGFLRLTDTSAEADRFITEVVAPTLRRPEAELRERLFVGTPTDVAERAEHYRAAGLDRLLLWPIGNEPEQLEAIADVLQLAPKEAATSTAS
ncbi:MAG: LLM class flavin-dependent oxidoreductase [Nitriliruptorales bacterium]|nr:LLM class flavin-dependent oxidoreductase [Nitriliruptorales bacterium]